MFVFDECISCPVAVTRTSAADDGDLATATSWALDAGDGARLSVWAHSRQAVSNNEFLQSLVNHPDVDLFLGSRATSLRANGPVIAFFPDREQMTLFNGVSGMTALSVVTWTHPLNVWADELGADILVCEDRGDDRFPGVPSEFAEPLTDVARREFEALSRLINLSNAITGGYEKRDAVRALERLRDSSDLPDPRAAIEWTAAHGWRWDNPKDFGKMVADMRAGKKLRIPGYMRR